MTNLVIKNNIRKFIKEIDKHNSIGSIGSDFPIELQKKVEDIINEAIKRAKSNNRRTLFARDL